MQYLSKTFNTVQLKIMKFNMQVAYESGVIYFKICAQCTKMWTNII